MEIFEAEDLFFKSLKNIFNYSETSAFKDFKVLKVLKEAGEKFILIKDIKEEFLSLNRKVFIIEVLIFIKSFERSQLYMAMNAMGVLLTLLEDKFIGVKITSKNIKHCEIKNGLEGRVMFMCFSS